MHNIVYTALVSQIVIPKSFNIFITLEVVSLVFLCVLANTSAWE